MSIKFRCVSPDIIARFILKALETYLVEENLSIIDESDTWTEEDQFEITSFSLQYVASIFLEIEVSGKEIYSLDIWILKMLNFVTQSNPVDTKLFYTTITTIE